MIPSAITAALLLPLPMLLSSKVLAAENVTVSDGGSAIVTLSARELTRISMADGGDKLDRLFGVDGAIDVKPDPSSGDVYVRPFDATAGKAFSFFVRDTRGATFTLVATVSDVPAQTILLHTDGALIRARHAVSSDDAEPYVRQVKALIRAMATNDTRGDTTRTHVGQVLPLWQQVQTTVDSRWSRGEGLQGETWTVRNASSGDVRLDETQFKSVYADTRAVAIDQQLLRTGDSTRVYLVREVAQ